jgi:hypothetical protein
MTEGFDQNYASSYVSDTTSLLSGATTEGRQDVSRWDLTEVSYKEEGGQRNGTRWVPTFDENKTAVAQKVLRLTLQRFHNIMTLVFEGDDKVKPMAVHSDAPTPHGAPSRDAARSVAASRARSAAAATVVAQVRPRVRPERWIRRAAHAPANGAQVPTPRPRSPRARRRRRRPPQRELQLQRRALGGTHEVRAPGHDLLL